VYRHDLVVIGTGSGNSIVDERFAHLDVAFVEQGPSAAPAGASGASRRRCTSTRPTSPRRSAPPAASASTVPHYTSEDDHADRRPP
jgi:hypothetical protein